MAEKASSPVPDRMKKKAAKHNTSIQESEQAKQSKSQSKSAKHTSRMQETKPSKHKKVKRNKIGIFKQFYRRELRKRLCS